MPRLYAEKSWEAFVIWGTHTSFLTARRLNRYSLTHDRDLTEPSMPHPSGKWSAELKVWAFNYSNRGKAVSAIFFSCYLVLKNWTQFFGDLSNQGEESFPRDLAHVAFLDILRTMCVTAVRISFC